MADNYLLRVTAGPSYDTSHHQPIAVNGPTSIHIDNEHATVNLHVRIQNYRGRPQLPTPVPPSRRTIPP